MKALIVGGAGFVGQHLLAHLKQIYPWELYCTKLPHEHMDISDVIVRNLDLLDKTAIQNLLTDIAPDYIFHLAAQSSVALSWKNPALTVDVNIKGCLNLLDALKECTFAAKVLLIGSGEEYGYIRPEDTPVTEETVPKPGNIYAATKACQNMLGAIYARAYGLSLVMVRAFNHIGPGQTPTFVVSDFCKQIADIEKGLRPPCISVGNLSAQRDFTDVRDVVRAYALLIQSGIPGETYNIGSGHSISIQTLLDKVLSYSKVPVTVEVSQTKLRPVDIPIIEADIRKLQQVVDWTPEIPLSVTIQETLDYWRQYKD